MFPESSGRGVGKGLSKSHPVVRDRIMAFFSNLIKVAQNYHTLPLYTPDKSVDFVRILNFH